jgi:hypothetical protein
MTEKLQSVADAQHAAEQREADAARLRKAHALAAALKGALTAAQPSPLGPNLTVWPEWVLAARRALAEWEAP